MARRNRILGTRISEYAKYLRKPTKGERANHAHDLESRIALRQLRRDHNIKPNVLSLRTAAGVA